MKITIKDIAADAHVSVSTVSRVLNGSESVNGELKARVIESVKKYNFRPSAAARSLVTRKTGLVAVLEADLQNPITTVHLKQISDICMQNNKIVLVSDYDFDNEKALLLLDQMLEYNIDGLIFQGVQLTEPILEKLREFRCPVVLGNQGVRDRKCEFNTVTVDSFSAAQDVTRFFLRDGHRRIAFVGGNADDYTNGYLRLKGYQEAMKAACLEIPDSYIAQGAFSIEAGAEGMKKIYETSEELPTAVVTGSDTIAVGVIGYLKSRGLKVPDDISVFGFDDSITDALEPALSTVRMSDQGAILYDALFGKLASEKEKRWTYFPYQLIRRSSTRGLSL